jgi:ferrous iron transport protein A
MKAMTDGAAIPAPRQATVLPLSQLPPGAEGRVTGVEGAPAVARRLASLGFRPGTPVLCVRRAPLGDPTVYRLRSYDLCLRRREAGSILVEPA